MACHGYDEIFVGRAFDEARPGLCLDSQNNVHEYAAYDVDIRDGEYPYFNHLFNCAFKCN